MPEPPSPPNPEDFWAEILSGDPARIRRAFDGVEPESRQPVREHLERMAGEAGWHPGQRERASIALTALRPDPDAPAREDE